jgi:hypothetical protein
MPIVTAARRHLVKLKNEFHQKGQNGRSVNFRHRLRPLPTMVGYLWHVYPSRLATICFDSFFRCLLQGTSTVTPTPEAKELVRACLTIPPWLLLWFRSVLCVIITSAYRVYFFWLLIKINLKNISCNWQKLPIAVPLQAVITVFYIADQCGRPSG